MKRSMLTALGLVVALSMSAPALAQKAKDNLRIPLKFPIDFISYSYSGNINETQFSTMAVYDTLVVFGTEFGRSPGAEGNGRDHHPQGFCAWLAGGGVRGGVHYGSTCEFGYKAVENKVHGNDLHATILHLLGMDHEKLTYRHNGRDYRLTDVGGNILREILA